MDNKIIDPGKLRSFQRVTSTDGYFLICALDHLSDFQELLDNDLSRVTYQQTGEAKNKLIRALADECSAFLLDARYGLAQAIASRALPARRNRGRASSGRSGCWRPSSRSGA